MKMREPFVERPNRTKPGFNIGVLLNKTKVVGDVGIEIEIEGKNLIYNHTTGFPSENWLYKEDHSLRGEESGEYVLNKPILFKDVKKVVDNLFSAFKKNKAKFDDSNRTSVHVHLNVQQFHLNRLASFMALWFCLEEILTQWCGEHRVGNLFCLRSRDATAIISHLRKFLKSEGKYELPELLHYSGFNSHALRKFGSIEIRTMRGVSDPKIIIDWVEILQRIYDFSIEFPDPRDVCGMFSGYGPLSMFNSILGSKVASVRAGVTWTDDEIKEAMYRGIRLAQDLCYCRDWSLYKPQEMKPDPFKRPSKTVSKKLLYAADSYSQQDSVLDQMLQDYANQAQVYVAGTPQVTEGFSSIDPFFN